MAHILYEPPPDEVKHEYLVTFTTRVEAASENEAQWAVRDACNLPIWDIKAQLEQPPLAQEVDCELPQGILP